MWMKTLPERLQKSWIGQLLEESLIHAVVVQLVRHNRKHQDTRTKREINSTPWKSILGPK